MVTYYVSTALFALFGLKMLHEGYHMSASEGQEEFEEAQAEVAKREMDLDAGKFVDMEAGNAGQGRSSSCVLGLFLMRSPIFSCKHSMMKLSSARMPARIRSQRQLLF
ncbi:hypothetical protein COOONC_19131 [Cooperia oncophora]